MTDINNRNNNSNSSCGNGSGKNGDGSTGNGDNGNDNDNGGSGNDNDDNNNNNKSLKAGRPKQLHKRTNRARNRKRTGCSIVSVDRSGQSPATTKALPFDPFE